MSNLVNVSGNPLQYDMSVTLTSDAKRKRSIDLRLKQENYEVFLYFGDSDKVVLDSHQDNCVELSLPLSEFEHILYLLENWTTTYIAISYKKDTKEVVNFSFASAAK